MDREGKEGQESSDEEEEDYEGMCCEAGMTGNEYRISSM